MGKEEGYQQQRRQVRWEIIESLLKFKFGELDNKIETIIISIINLPMANLAKLILELPDLSSAELLDKLTS